LPRASFLIRSQIAVENLEHALSSAGMGFDDIAHQRAFMTAPARTEGFMQGAAGHVRSPPAATTLIYVKAPATAQLLIEIEAVAAKELRS
jgi:enamine deaminase RidA (YjgF/YER057c/UK114 family)